LKHRDLCDAAEWNALCGKGVAWRKEPAGALGSVQPVEGRCPGEPRVETHRPPDFDPS